MPTSLRDLIENTRHSLSGFDSSREAVLELAETVNSSELTIPVNEVSAQSGAGRGFVEIDLELIRVKAVDTSGVALEAFTFGRGYRGTPAATHTAGTEIRVNPMWPMSTIAKEINGLLSEIANQIYVVETYETTIGDIEIPAEATGIIAVYVEDPIKDNEWFREDRWSWQPDASDIGKGLRVGGRYRDGEPIRVVYARRPGTFDLTGSLTQDFTTVTGLDEYLADLIRLGVAARVAPYFDTMRLPSTSAVPRFDGESRGPSAGANAVRVIDAMYQRRLQQEAASLDRRHPIRVHFTGRL